MSQPLGARVETLADLERIYGLPAQRSIIKEQPALTAGYRALIEASPFVLVASSGPQGLDCSPRGDRPGFVRVEDERTLLIPDRRGNNRVDTLRNIVVDPRVALLFMVPGCGETLRVNGRADILIEPALLASFAIDDHSPRSVLRVVIDAVYFQCARAVMRSGLWAPALVDGIPSVGTMLKECQAEFDAAAYDATLRQTQRDTLY